LDEIDGHGDALIDQLSRDLSKRSEEASAEPTCSRCAPSSSPTLRLLVRGGWSVRQLGRSTAPTDGALATKPEDTMIPVSPRLARPACA
jgi:hypothetical protein